LDGICRHSACYRQKQFIYSISLFSFPLCGPKTTVKILGHHFLFFSLLYTVFLWKSQYSLLHHFLRFKIWVFASIHIFSFSNYIKLAMFCLLLYLLVVPIQCPVWMLWALFAGCGGQVTRPGIIKNTNILGMYSEEANCTWNITAPPGRAIVLRWAQWVVTV